MLVHQETSRYLCHECMLLQPSLSFSSLTRGAPFIRQQHGLQGHLTYRARVASVVMGMGLVSLFVNPPLEPTGAGQNLHEPERTPSLISAPFLSLV